MAATAPIDIWPADYVDHFHCAGGDAELAGLFNRGPAEAVQSIRPVPCTW